MVFAVVDIWHKGKISITSWLFTILILFAQFYTASYVGAIGMCIYTLVLFIFSKRIKFAGMFAKWIPLVVSELCFFLICMRQKLVFQLILEFGAQLNRLTSVSYRGIIWDLGLSAILEKPCGYGFYCDYSRLIRIGAYLPSSAHNLYIDVTIQTGILGAILFIIFLFMIMRNMPSWEKWPVIPASLFSYAVMWNFEPYFVDLYLQCTLLILYLMFSLPTEKDAHQ